MFDLIAGREKRLPSRAGLPVVLSAIAQLSVIGAVAATSIMLATDKVPEVPDMPAFVVTAAPPPPPPPPAPAPSRAKPTTPSKPLVPVERPVQAPIEEPPIVQEALRDEGTDFDVPGGVEGGVPGGVVGGVVGGLPDPVPPPPPPSPSAPVRVGGQIKTPALVRRVEPYYPPLAVAARLQGTVILEAVIDRSGAVTGLKVIRSSGTPVLDREAELAVRQWQYEPLLLNGRREPFVLTVTLSFNLNSTS